VSDPALPSVRLAGSDDAPALRDLILAFRDHLGADKPARPELERSLPAALADPALEFCLAFSAELEPLGYAHSRFFTSVWASGQEAHLEDLFVAEQFRGRGVGGRLLDFVIARARERHAVALGLHTNENNEAAQAFYRRAGFEPRTEVAWDGGREVYWGRRV